MVKDARLLLNRRKQQKRNPNNRTNIQDARQVISARKKGQSRGVLNRNANGSGQLRMNKMQYGLVTKKNMSVNQRLRNSPIQLNLVKGLINTPQNRSPGFIMKKFLNQSNRNPRQAQNARGNFARNWKQNSNPNNNTWQQQRSIFQNRNNNAAAGAQRFLSRESNITVTRPIWREARQQVDDRDELERMTIDDVVVGSKQPAFSLSAIQSPQTYTRQNQYLSSPMAASNSANMARTSDSGCRVLVCNLRHSVTENDISELFGDIGMMRSANLIEPGRAEIEYYSEDSAIRACSVYHDVLLDGQPMSCTIQKSHEYRKPISSRLGEKISNQMPIRYQQPTSAPRMQEMMFSSANDHSREVSFIVKLP